MARHSRAEFGALESALLEDLRPEGAVQTLLARADRLEFELLIGSDPNRAATP